ncbi:hypothetical protein AEQ18_00085 [Enterococcus sp. RIT-PI-f]|nr:hypothetical protein AEQ18_00085 [Enterococcus sp. RIT-PI-f]
MFGLSLFIFGVNLASAEELNVGDSHQILVTNEDFKVNEKEIVQDFLNNENIDELVVINPELATDEILSPDESAEESIQTRAGVTRYKVNNVKSGSNYTGGQIAIAVGEPDIPLSINQTKSVSTTVSAKFGASNKLISGEVGWSVTGSTSISIIGGPYTVPKTVGKKKVKNCSLIAKTVYKTKTFDVHKMPWNSFQWSKQGTGTIKKAYGVSFSKKFVYK